MKFIGLPNTITLTRFFVIPLIPYFYLTHQRGWALLILCYAGFSDLLDGALARLMGQRSKLGAILDPAADKSLMLVSFLTLGVARQLPLWLVLLVIVRDVYIVLGVWVLKIRHRKIYIKPTYLSKMTTFFQLGLLFFCFTEAYLKTSSGAWLVQWDSFVEVGLRVSFYLVCVFTGLSGLHYTLVGIAITRGRLEEGIG